MEAGPKTQSLCAGTGGAVLGSQGLISVGGGSVGSPWSGPRAQGREGVVPSPRAQSWPTALDLWGLACELTLSTHLAYEVKGLRTVVLEAYYCYAFVP